MKKIILTTIIIVFYHNIFAQSDYYTTIKTPTNVSVEVLYRVEYSAGTLAYIEGQAKDWISDHNSKAVRVAPASRTYNCHDYAWHYSDGGTKRWVNKLNRYGNANLSKYWSGSSPTYQQTSSSKATKVFYSDADHSAKVISSNVYESKWGEWPRYRHAPNDCPYTTSNKQYYAVLITGSNLICSSNSYSTLNISGASYNWSGNKVSISGNGSLVTATKTSNGTGWIKTQISSPYSGTTIKTARKTFWVGLKATLSGNSSVLCLKTGTWKATASCGYFPYNYDWFLRKEGSGMGAVMLEYEHNSTLTLKSVKEGTKTYFNNNINPLYSYKNEVNCMNV